MNADNRETKIDPDYEPTLRSLLYRYFFFTWLFRDASRGDFMERSASRRFNQQRSAYLLTYLMRWLVLVVLGYAMGLLFERSLGLVFAAALFYCVSTISIAISASIARLWLVLRYG